MCKFTRVLLFSLLLLAINSALSKDLNISDAALNKVKKIFGDKNIRNSNKIHIKINSGQKLYNNEYLVTDEVIIIKFMYLGKSKDIELIGVYIDGNINPLVTSLSPGESVKSNNPYFVVTGKVDNYCEGHYKALIVMKIKNHILANNAPFKTTIADCGGGNG